MKLSVWEIPEEGLEFSLEKEKEWMETYHSGWPSIYRFASQIKGSFKVKRFGTKVVVEGSIKTELELECSRCLSTFCYPLTINFVSELYPLEDFIFRSSEPVELRKNEMEMEFYSKGILDIEEVMSTNIILNIPTYPLCKENCKGICPDCGKNLNYEECTCKKEKTIKDERWRALESLKNIFQKK
jgi:uncharacterized protein